MARVNRKNPCPICGQTDWCGYVQAIGYSQAIVICMRVQSAIQAGNGGWIHKLSEDDKPVYVPPEANDNPIADADKRNRVYRLLLSKLTLADRHVDHILDRGVDEGFIQAKGFKTLPLDGRYQLSKEIRSALGDDALVGIPGFRQAEGKHGFYWTLGGRPGLLIPILDVERRVIGCQIRVDDPPEGVKKYQTLSSGAQPGGTSCGILFHVAIPSVVDDPEEVWITEGPIKAEIAAEFLNRKVVAVTGVANWRGICQVLQELGAKKVITAYDFDDKPKTVEIVRHHLKAMLADLKVAGFIVEKAWWPKVKGKGIDDLLMAGFKALVRQYAA